MKGEGHRVGLLSRSEDAARSIAARSRRFVVRHRVSIQDLGVIVAVLLVVAYLAFEVDIFVTQGEKSPAEQVIELDEALLLGGLLAIGLFCFAVRRHLDQKREMRRRMAAEREARELAYQDPLTGLPNRRQFEEALKTAAASPPAAGSCHAVLMLDLNGFKQVNDTYGHGIGDELLVVVAQRLLRAVREGDLVARLGGDEFVVLAPHLLGPEAAASIALRIIQQFSQPISTGNVQHRIGTGIGIALLTGDGTTSGEALRRADLALYRAKAERQSSFRFFEEEMDRFVRERERMERTLRLALDQDLIRARFRPSVDLDTGAVLGFEAVPSWTTAEGEEIPAERFLPIAEETGLVHIVARRVLEQACNAAKQWPDNVMLTIDVLPAQLKDRNFASGILEFVEAAGLPPERLEVDVAESLIVQDLETAKRALTPLRQAGVKIALANFGTGYSNLYHMQELGFDKVKIDRRFVGNLDEEGAAKVVRALAGLGSGFGLSVSADGVAGTGAKSALLASGIREGQSSEQALSADAALRCFEAPRWRSPRLSRPV